MPTDYTKANRFLAAALQGRRTSDDLTRLLAEAQANPAVGSQTWAQDVEKERTATADKLARELVRLALLHSPREDPSVIARALQLASCYLIASLLVDGSRLASR